MGKTYTKKCTDLIKKWEGCQLKAYQDEVGVWTIGYGTTNSDFAITNLRIKKGVTITQEQADDFLELSLKNIYLPAVLKYDKIYDWNQNEIDALVSFAYNIGSIDGLTKNGKRTRAEISNYIPLYCKAGGKVYRGLQNRRKDELKLFDTPAMYTGKLPTKYPDRGYYQKGDGFKIIDRRGQIKRVQRFLNWALCASLKVDGKYGDLTAAAVEKFQTRAGIEDVNGKWGTKCSAAAMIFTI